MGNKMSRTVYGIWLAALAVLLAAYSLQYRPVINLEWGSVRSTCFLLFAMCDLLNVLMLVFDFSLAGQKNNRAIDSRTIDNKAIDGRAMDNRVTDGRMIFNRTIGQDSDRLTNEQGRSRFLPYIRQLAVFALATVLFWCYCFPLKEFFATNSTIDALVAGGLLCAAAVVSSKIN